MIAGMAPALTDGRFVFCTATDPVLAARAAAVAVATFREDEGLSLILPFEAAVGFGLDTGLPMRCITLAVFSALDGVGLTAEVAGVLADAGIPCNMVAAYHHDHAFVPEDRAEAALGILVSLSSGTAPGKVT